VAVASLLIAVLAVVVENNFDVDSQQVGLIRVNVVGPVFLVSLALLFVLWVRRNAKHEQR
jgi:Na+/melibiose symporter-like transporter